MTCEFILTGVLVELPDRELLVGVDAKVLRVRRPVVHHQLPVSRHRLRRAVEDLNMKMLQLPLHVNKNFEKKFFYQILFISLSKYA